MTIDWAHDAQAIAASALTTTILTALFSAFLRRRENRQVSEQNKEIEMLKSRQREFENRSKTQFDWLHQERAKAAVEVYALVIDLDIALSRLLEKLAHGNPTHEEKIKLYEGANVPADAFRKRYVQVGLLLPEPVLNRLETLDDLLWRKTTLAFVYGKDQSADDRLILAKENDVTKSHGAIRELRAALRIALGDVANDARSKRLSRSI